MSTSRRHEDGVAPPAPSVGTARADRIVASLTLTALPAPAALGVIGALIVISWCAAYFLGGGTNVAPHWFYVPVFLAGLRFGPIGALVTAVVSTFVCGPLLPADVATGAPQSLSDWVSRGIFFLVIGQFVTQLIIGVRRLSLREVQLRHQAFHDPLTGLANRALFSEHLAGAVLRHGPAHGSLGVMFVDLDSFKAVNDLHGHMEGDELLQQMAQRLLASLGEATVIARLGGDEFGVIFEGNEFVSKLPSIVATLTASFARPFRVHSAEVFVTASLGVALNDSGTESAEDLLRNADLAMYAAKTRDKGSFEVFSSDMHSRILTRMQMESDLSHGLANHEFEIHYQPVVDLASAKVESVEALIRWNHPERGLITPGEFIEAAESSGNLLTIGTWVLRRACEEFQFLSRNLTAGEDLGLSVNLSNRQIRDPLLFDVVRRALDDARLDPARLTLEVVESSIMVDVASTFLVLSQLRGIGVKIAIDDFGTGFSSLSLLSEIPIDTLKIDQSFVREIARRPEPARLIRTILLLAEEFGLLTVAEGVENLEQLQILRDLGCKAGQGYYFGRPQPVVDLVELLKNNADLALGRESVE